MSDGAITHLFFDVAGVLGTGGWDSPSRQRAVRHFGLDWTDFDQRHRDLHGAFETGRLSLEEYLDTTVFHEPRSFTREEFRRYMFSLSEPFPDSIALVQALARAGRWRLSTINNESEELNVYRLRRFGLPAFFGAFFSSCWMGSMKPERRIYQQALAMTQADPARSVFIDDRERNLEPAAALGMHVIHFTSAEALREALARLGVTGE